MAWDIEWAAERAGEALAYLVKHYPESAGSPELHPHQDAAHDTAVAGDEARYLEALRGFMRAGRDEGPAGSEGGRVSRGVILGKRLSPPNGPVPPGRGSAA